MNTLSPKGYGIPKTNLSEHDLKEMKNELTVKPFSPFELTSNSNEYDDKQFQVFRESSNKIYVPRNYGLKKFGKAKYQFDPSQSINPVFKGTLRDYQQAPVNAYLECTSDDMVNSGIINIPPGFGKTVIALYIISRLKVKTLIVVHKDFLLSQWKERIEQYLGNVTVGILKQNKAETDKDIVIASLQSIVMRGYNSKVFDGFGLQIIDEAHHIAAKIFSQSFYAVNCKHILGLSATIQRKDGLTKVLKWFMGDIVCKMKAKGSSDVRVKVLHYDNPDPLYKQVPLLFNGKPNVSRLITRVCEFKPRTQLIAREIKEILDSDPGRNVIVLSDRRDHLNDIDMELKAFDIVDTGLYVGGMKEQNLKISETKQILLGTFSMVAEGFDLPKLNTMILASSKSDIEQAVGRIQRQLPHERTYDPYIIDIADDLSIFGSQSKKRKDFYRKKGYSVEVIGEKKQKIDLPRFAFTLEDE
jgi:superfamily II DNA or RNA helicase